MRIYLKRLDKKRQDKNMTRLHETNYIKLFQIVPDLLRLTHGKLIDFVYDDNQIQILVEEHTKYTSQLRISMRFKGSSHFIPRINIQVRLYHDAKVAEVIDFQHKRRFHSRYSYPNPGMYQRNEKQQINLFLADWLDHCIQQGIVIHHEEYLSN